MAKKQTRRSISVSRTTYERLKAFCEANNISMSQFVETRVGDFLGEGQAPSITSVVPTMPRPTLPAQPSQPRPAIVPQPVKHESRPVTPMHHPVAAPQQVPMTSAAARFAVEPPPPVIKQKQQETAPKPTEKRPDQIFTF
ncbi:MAG: hypothetical protein ABI591_27770 [Kofleriaceae bacterium]